MSSHKSSSELKALARGQLLGHYGTVIWAMMLAEILQLIATDIVTSLLDTSTTFGTVVYYAVTILTAILLGLFSVGQAYLFLKLACGQMISISDIFYGFRKQMDKSLIVLTVITVLINLCTAPYTYFMGKLMTVNISPSMSFQYAWNFDYFLPFCIAFTLGSVAVILIDLLFSQVFYLLLDFPDYSAKDILLYGIRLMKGNMGRLFYIEVSFIPLFLLGILSLGIGLLWITPYVNATMANFFLDLMEHNNDIVE